MDFRFLSDNDFAKLGFRCGLEVHQQLLTRKKLFCRCPAGLYSRDHDAEVLRHMRPTLSELGEYDGTALMEFKTRKEVIYLLNSESVCTYEMDDAPPFELNEEALDIALEMALLLGCSLVGEIHVTRKQYLDGSIPAGFQRTAIVGVDGFIPFRGRKIGIRQLAVEEDACREVSDRGHRITFRTDRLSIPLTETVTEPHMVTPEEAAAVCMEIGRLARVTGKVRRGIGSVRQDVNVSIEGSTRVEIKGVPRIPFIERLVTIEAHRHKALLDIREALRERGLTADAVRDGAGEIHDVTGIFRSAGCGDRISTSLSAPGKTNHTVRAVRLRGFKNILVWPTQPGLSFSDEISGRVRVIACLDELPNLYHSEQPPVEAEGAPGSRLWRDVRQESGAGPDDVVVLVWGPNRDADTAAQEVIIRAAEAAEGVPNETRQPRPGGRTDFERILPGPDRMYPDTDMPPKAISDDRIEMIRQQLPSRPWEREDLYAEWGLRLELAREMAISARAPLFERIVRELDVHPVRAAVPLLETLKAVGRKGLPADRIPDGMLFEMFRRHAEGRLHREAFSPVIEALSRLETAWDPADPPVGGIAGIQERTGTGRTVGDLTALDLALGRLGLAAGSEPPNLAAAVSDAVAETEPNRYTDPRRRFRHAMGLVMGQVRGRVAGREAAGALERALG